jgi:hypothetical protein
MWMIYAAIAVDLTTDGLNDRGFAVEKVETIPGPIPITFIAAKLPSANANPTPAAGRPRGDDPLPR